MAHINNNSYHIDSILIVRNGKLVFDAIIELNPLLKV